MDLSSQLQQLQQIDQKEESLVVQLQEDIKNAKQYISEMLGWEDIRGEEIVEDGKVMGYRGTAPTHVHTIDPAKSELYGGQQVTYIAPYTRCDRIDDYRRAWSHFEKIFNNK